MAARSSDSPLSILKSPFVLKLAAVIAGLYLAGYAAPLVLDPQSSFTGVTVGIAWSLATLILIISALVIGLAIARSSLRS